MSWARRNRLPLLVILVLLLGVAGAGGWWWRDSARAEARAARLAGGDPARGRDLLRRYGCTACHIIPGVRGADGRVGPSLDRFAGRVYIGGVVDNTAANLIRWIEDPRGIDRDTAMPRTGATGQDARDIAAFLYTLR